MNVDKVYQIIYLGLFLILIFFTLQTVFAGSISVTHGSNLSKLESQLEQKRAQRRQLHQQISKELSIQTIFQAALDQGYIAISNPIIAKDTDSTNE